VNKITIVLLVIFVAFSFYIGTWFGSKDKVPSSYKHKYDSLQTSIKSQDKIMIDNNKVKDSLKRARHELKFKSDSVKQAGIIQEKNLKARREALIQHWIKSPADTIAKELTKRFVEAHPAPLFDSTNVTVDKNVGIHFLERDEEATDLEMKLANTEELLKIETNTTANLTAQLERAKVDSLALNNKFVASQETVLLRDDEIKDIKKEHRRELRRQKVQKVVVTVIAVGVIIISLVTH